MTFRVARDFIGWLLMTIRVAKDFEKKSTKMVWFVSIH